MRIGQQIKLLRLRQGMTQAELAEKSGVSLQTVSLCETGKCEPYLSTSELMLDALGCELCIRKK